MKVRRLIGGRLHKKKYNDCGCYKQMICNASDTFVRVYVKQLPFWTIEQFWDCMLHLVVITEGGFHDRSKIFFRGF